MKIFEYPGLSSAARSRSLLVAVCAATLLVACGGGGDDTPPAATVLTSAADTLTLNAGETGALLGNDRVGTAVATAGASGNVVFSLTSGALPVGVTVVDGVVAISNAAAPGVLTLSYRICERASPANCATGTAQVTIPTPAIVAVNDSFNLAAGASGDVLANDTLGGTAANAGRVVANATAALPAGVTLSAAGLVTVDGTAAAGTYAVAYRICQTVASGNCASASASITVPSAGALTGRAVDAATAAGIAGVTVRAGAVSTITDAAGAFILNGTGLGQRLSVVFTSSTHAETTRLAVVEAGRSTDVQARLLRVGTTATVAADTGGTVSMLSSPARVVLGAGALQRADGSLPTGNITVRMTPINPAVDSSLMPGDFTTLVSGVATPIESFGALNVELADTAGVALNLRSGQTATIRIPLATRSASSPATIPLFYFDNTSGRWVQEGTATLAGTSPNQYYEGTVTHFSTWNADRVADTVLITGCVADVAGVRQVGAAVFSDGVDYSGTSRATTDAAGNFTIAVRINSAATLTALAGNTLSNTLRVSSGAVDSTLPNCLALGQVGSVVTMKLTWGSIPDDLDSHLFAPDGVHVYYGNDGSLGAAPFANLDVDDTSSFGPEVITITKLMVGTYKYAVKNFSGQGSGLFSAASARVELSLPGRALELFVPPATGESSSTDWWLLFELDVDAACNITVRRTGTFSSSTPAAAPSNTPVYCTRP